MDDLIVAQIDRTQLREPISIYYAVKPTNLNY